MKNDKEFLKGIYEKAEILEREKTQSNSIYKKYMKYSSVAALIIILPLIFKSEILSPKNNEIQTPEPRIIMMNNPVSNFTESDYIVIGKIKEIDKGETKEESIDVIVSLEDKLLGDIYEDEIILKMPSYMEDEFKEGNRSLLFLYKDENQVYKLFNEIDGQFIELVQNVFVDKLGNQYSLEDIKKNIDRRSLK